MNIEEYLAGCLPRFEGKNGIFIIVPHYAYYYCLKRLVYRWCTCYQPKKAPLNRIAFANFHPHQLDVWTQLNSSNATQVTIVQQSFVCQTK